MTEAGDMKPIVYAWVVIQPLVWRPTDVQQEATLNALCRHAASGGKQRRQCSSCEKRRRSSKVDERRDEEASARSLRPSPVDERRRLHVGHFTASQLLWPITMQTLFDLSKRSIGDRLNTTLYPTRRPVPGRW
jgi:hypothetical protein